MKSYMCVILSGENHADEFTHPHHEMSELPTARFRFNVSNPLFSKKLYTSESPK